MPTRRPSYAVVALAMVLGGPAAGCGPAVPVPRLSAEEARLAGVLPAGLWFRNSYLAVFAEEEGWPAPTRAVILGPFPDGPAAAAAVAESERFSLPPGYPLVVHSDALGLRDDRILGLVVVTGLFADDESARRWVDARSPAGARVEPLLDDEAAWERLLALPGEGMPRLQVVRIAPGPSVAAYPLQAVETAEEHHWNWSSEADRGPDPLVVPPAEPLCTVEPGSIFALAPERFWSLGFRWVPVDCPAGPAAVPRLDTLVDTVFAPGPEGRYRLFQVGEVSCDVACFCRWVTEADGVRPGDVSRTDACDCPPSCGYDGCS